MTARLYQQDVTAIEGLARQVLEQCEHYRRNGPGDEIRLGLLYNLSARMVRRARRGYRRLHRERGWQWNEWWKTKV